MSNLPRSALAIAAAAVALLALAWFDSTVIRDAQRQAAATFSPAPSYAPWALGLFLTAGAVLMLALLAWWSRSLAVGVLYAVVGAFLAVLPWILWTFAAQVNDTPPVLPEPLVTALSDLYQGTAGPLNAGVAVIVRSLRGRSTAAAVTSLPGPAGQPNLP